LILIFVNKGKVLYFYRCLQNRTIPLNLDRYSIPEILKSFNGES